MGGINGWTEKCGDYWRARVRTDGKITTIKSRLASQEEAAAALEAYRGRTVVNTDEPAFDSNKKQGVTSWREWTRWIQHGQQLKREASYSQDSALIDFGHVTEPIAVIFLSDLHMGSWATDYEQLVTITDEILHTPNLYVALVGDMLQMAIKMRNVLEVSDNAIPPEQQLRFFESWLTEIEPRVLFGTWANHEVMREEAATGYSAAADIIKRRVVYHNGIGHPDIKVGREIYRMAVSHRFRGGSELNPCQGQVKYARLQAPDREIIVQGDTHKPGLLQYMDGQQLRLALNCGSIQTQSGYSRRHFSLYTSSAYPVVELYPDRHLFVGHWSLQNWRDSRQGAHGTSGADRV
jgi:hypothetical protein